MIAFVPHLSNHGVFRRRDTKRVVERIDKDGVDVTIACRSVVCHNHRLCFTGHVSGDCTIVVVLRERVTRTVIRDIVHANSDTVIVGQRPRLNHTSRRAAQRTVSKHERERRPIDGKRKIEGAICIKIQTFLGNIPDSCYMHHGIITCIQGLRGNGGLCSMLLISGLIVPCRYGCLYAIAHPLC